jgi:membrane-associated phospholipid phosphatase
MPERDRMALAGAAASIGLLILIWFSVFHIGFVQRADASILQGFGDLASKPRVNSVATFVARLCDPKPYIYFCVIPVAIAVARRRTWVALAIIAILLGANVTTQLLKPLLAAPRPDQLVAHAPSAASWPSGHATAAMALALCMVIAVPARFRPVAAAIGAAFAVVVSYSFLTLMWHFPSDVLGGFLVAATWTLLAVAAVLRAGARGPSSARIGLGQRITVREALGPPAATALFALGLAVLVVVSRPGEVVAYARVHEAFVLGAVAIGALGLAVATGVMLTLRR